MDKDKALKHFNEVIVPEWMPDIHYQAHKLHEKHKESGRVSHPSDLYEAGIRGLMISFINWDPNLAEHKKSGFRTFANNTISGQMSNEITGHLSHGKQGVIDPGVELESRKFNRQQQFAQQQPEQAPAIPPVPSDKPKV